MQKKRLEKPLFSTLERQVQRMNYKKADAQTDNFSTLASAFYYSFFNSSTAKTVLHESVPSEL